MKPNTDLEAIFAEAIELADPARRGAFLDDACAGDDQMRNRVARLLAANQRSASFMSEPAAVSQSVAMLTLADDEHETREIGEQAGDVVGPYKLLERVGDGGMGTVFKAEQTEPLRREVALKLIKPGLDTREVIARFDTERQALALMDSPYIARVYDAGATEQGRPYFAMEFVDGQPISDFCNAKRLNSRERLELFVKVCRGIQHAHMKGIVHRDIKPSNVLVEGQSEHGDTACPKIIDFGIAKAVDSDSTVITSVGEIVGTPTYMSPEQASAELDIDTRSDVYSLGALLYELLVGSPPFDADPEKPLTREEMRRRVREESPQRPSDALQAMIDTSSRHKTTIAKDCVEARNSTPRGLKSDLRGELDWIVMRALEKDRDRRYETASSFADDVERYLKNEPVVARPTSALYRLKKFVARNRLAVAALSAIAATVLISTAITGRALQNTKLALANEKTERATREQHVEFVNKGLFLKADPLSEPNRNVTLRTVLDRASQELANQKFDLPEVEAQIRGTLGRAYFGLGEYATAITQLRTAYQIQKDVSGNHDRKSLELEAELARTFLAAGKMKEAETCIYQLELFSESALKDDNDALLQKCRLLKASHLSATGEHEQAEGWVRNVLEARTTALGAHDVETLKAKANLASILQSLQRYKEALKLLTEAHQGMLQAADRWDPVALRVTRDLASLHIARNEFDRAKQIYSETIPKLIASLGPTHPQTLTAKHGEALVFFSEGDIQLADETLATVLAEQKKQLGAEHPSTLWTMHNLALAKKATEQYALAETLLTDELTLRRKHFGDDNRATQQAISNLAFFLLEQGEFAKAISHYESMALDPARLETDSNAITVWLMLGYCQFKANDFESAASTLETAKDASEKLPPPWMQYIVTSLLGEVYWELDRRNEGEDMMLAGYEGLSSYRDDIPPRWQPMGLRAATRRLAEFYESAESQELRDDANVYRDELKQLQQEVLQRQELRGQAAEAQVRKTEDGTNN